MGLHRFPAEALVTASKGVERFGNLVRRSDLEDADRDIPVGVAGLGRARYVFQG